MSGSVPNPNLPTSNPAAGLGSGSTQQGWGQGIDPGFEGSLDGSFMPIRTESEFETSKATKDATLTLPPITASAENPVQKCNEQCAEMKKNIRKECNIMRKRVQEALKEKGCPSRVTAYASKKSGCQPKKKQSKKKKKNCGC
jgi:hypothetical protein